MKNSAKTRKPARFTPRPHTIFDYCIEAERFDDAAVILLFGTYLLLDPIAPEERDSFIDGFGQDPDALDRVLTAVDDWLDAQKR